MSYSVEQRLYDLIIERYGTFSAFSEVVGLSRSTLSSILKRGILNSNVDNVRVICQTLGLSMDELVAGRVVSRADAPKPDPVNIDKSLSDFCRDIQLRDDLYMNGRPLDHDGAVTLADLIELAVGFIQKRQ